MSEKPRWSPIVSIVSGTLAVVSLVWVIMKPGFDSWTALLGTVLTSLGSGAVWVTKSGRVSQAQNVEKASVGIQAAGDVKTCNIGGGKNAK